MFKIDELAGSLVKSGRFLEAAPKFADELDRALMHGVITRNEAFGANGIIVRYIDCCCYPENVDGAESLGNDLIFIAIRIPNYVQKA